MVDSVYTRFERVLREFGEKSEPPYERTTAPFSFDVEPETDAAAYYVEPPQTRHERGRLGGAAFGVLTITAWLAAESTTDAAAESTRLAEDLTRLQRAVRRADLGNVLVIAGSVRLVVAPRRGGAVVAMGRLQLEIELDGDR